MTGSLGLALPVSSVPVEPGSDEARRLLFEMDRSLMHLRSTVGETDPGVIGLTGTYHNLLRMWVET